MIALAVEVWTINAGILFDNFVIGHSIEDAFDFARETFVVKHQAEKKAAKDAQKASSKAIRQQKLETGNLSEYMAALSVDYIEYLSENPGVIVLTLLAVLIPLIYFLIYGGGGEGEVEKNRDSNNSSQKRGTTASASATTHVNSKSDSNCS